MPAPSRRCPSLRRPVVTALALLAPLALTPALPLAGRAQTSTANESSIAGNKGAQVYCFMRNNGNIHEVSWAAAYALIKRQSASLFKTSPEHAAVMITEAVVQNPTSYPDCGRYLGDLYTRRRTVVLSSGAYPQGAAPAGAAAGSAMPATGMSGSNPGGGSQSRW